MTYDITASIISKLKADTAVAAKVSTRVFREITSNFPGLPCIVVAKIDDLRSPGSSTGRYSVARIQCSSYATTDAAADELSELIADALDRTKNTMTGTVLADAVQVIGIDDAGTVPDSDPKIPVYIYHRDFIIEYSIKLTR
jgi:hypothetical protein